MNIRLVAKKVFIYVGITAVISIVLIFLNYINNLIIKSYPGLPAWMPSVILALIISIGILFAWFKLRKTDFLKYEFIDVITHRFRTPLTTIKWSSESLMGSAPENLKEEIGHIQKSTNSLVDLTNLLANLSVTDEKTFDYNFVKLDLNSLIEDLVNESQEKVKAKNITLLPLANSTNFVLADEHKIKFVFQTLLDNAISYTDKGGKVSFEIFTNEQNVTTKVIDTGIGIDENEIKHIFTKFYRTEAGKKTDTEGMGIGLYLAQIIIEKHHGKIWVESKGEGKGSSFFVSLPIYKE